MNMRPRSVTPCSAGPTMSRGLSAASRPRWCRSGSDGSDEAAGSQAKGRLDNWLERRHSDGIARRDILLEIVAIALDRGELPPKPLCEWAAKVLRGLIKDNARGTLLYRDACIAGLLIDLESWDFTLFPNPAGKRQGQVYGCDIVIEAFKKIDIDLTVDIIKNLWKESSHRWAHHRRPLSS